MDKQKIVAAAMKLAKPASGLEDVVKIMLENAVVVKPDGSFIIADKNGNRRYTYIDSKIADMNLLDLVDELRRERPSLFKSDDEPANDEPEAYAGENPFAKGHMDLHKASELFRQNPTLARRLMAEADGTVATSGNPWSKAHWNLTRQMTLVNTNPDEAARLKQEAGIR